MKRSGIALLALLLCGPIALAQSSDKEARLLRQPTIHNDHLAFVYAGDLWLLPSTGGQASRLTTSAGLEMFPRFSPDGKWIAFTAEYDGNREVYVISTNGGEPRRLTYNMDQGSLPERLGPNNLVMGWTPDSRNVLFRSRFELWNGWMGRLYTIGLDGGLPEALPIPHGGFTSFSPDGKRIAYNRNFREFRTWKRYRGGQADDVWIYDLAAQKLENITNNPAQDFIPMWVGDKIYYLSDRDRTANLFEYDLKTKTERKVTDYTEFDVKWPSAGEGGIAYENGGYLYVLDPATNQSRKVSVTIASDMAVARPLIVPVTKNITDYNLSPDGKRALFGARGEIFTVPAENGNTRNLTNTSGTKERGSTWSPDGKWIAYISDATGEDQLYVIAQDGKGAPVQLTADFNVWLFPPVWSPDSKKLAFADKSLNLYYLDIDTKKVTKCDRAVYWEITDYSWSPDSKWITYSKPAKNGFSSIFVYSLEQNKVLRITDDFQNDFNPVFDPDGKYLIFFSDRDYNSYFLAFEYNFGYDRTTSLYLIPLQKTTPSPFAPKSDEVKIEEKKDESKKGEKKEEKKDVKKSDVQIDFENIAARTIGFPMTAGNYGGIRAAKGKVFFLSFGSGRQTGGPVGKTSLHVYDIEKQKDTEWLEADNYDIAPGLEKIIYGKNGTYGIVDVSSTPKIGDGKLDLSNMEMKLVRTEEWRQIFHDVWQQERDFFYDPDMHGYDWKTIGDRYAALLPHVTHRSDLTYVLSEMIAELNCSHAYVGGGDMPSVKSVGIGLLGADLVAKDGYYQIRNILEGQNWDETTRSPLTEAGLDIKNGDYLIAINGKPIRPPANPYALLENTVGTIVTLTVHSKPSDVGGRDIQIKPIADESKLRYFNWVENNRRKVDRATDGKVAYIHVPDMGGFGLNSFVKYFYPQVGKEGVIVDVRWNGGGNVSRMLIERLRRTLLAMGVSRNAEKYTYPDGLFTGPMVCLLNQWSASDGDIFPYAFKKAGLGPLIGKRSWGGVIGIRGTQPLVDGGYISRPEFGFFSTESRFVVEGRGVEPDIEVDNLPADELAGTDAQLDRGIEEVVKMMKEKSGKLPEKPGQYPKK